MPEEHTVTGVWRSFSGGFALGSPTDNFSPGGGRELPADWVAGGAAYVRAVWLEETADDGFQLTVTIARDDAGLGTGGGPDFVADIESRVRLTLVSPAGTFETDLSQDTTEPYVFEPPGLGAFLNGLSNNDAGSLVFDLGDFRVAAAGAGVSGELRPVAVTLRSVADPQPVAARSEGVAGQTRAAILVREPLRHPLAARFAGVPGEAALHEITVKVPVRIAGPDSPLALRGLPGSFGAVAIALIPVAADQPIAARFAGVSGVLAAAIGVREPDRHPISTLFQGVPGISPAVPVSVIAVEDNEPVAARFDSVSGIGSAVIEVRPVPENEPIAARAVGIAGSPTRVAVVISDVAEPLRVAGVLVIPGDGYAIVQFDELADTRLETEYEYSLDGGAWTAF